MKVREDFTCPLELVHDMLKGKWKPIILWRLRLGPASLSRLQKDIAGISQKMLLEQLKELIEAGFAGKKVFLGYPLKVEYSLTETKGQKILESLKIMQEIGEDIIEKTGSGKYSSQKCSVRSEPSERP